MYSRSFSIKRHTSIKKKVSDLNLKDGQRNAYEILRNARNQKCDTLPSGIGNIHSKNNDQTQWTVDTPEGVSQNSGE